MRQLDSRTRNEVLRLFFFGYTYDEITDRLGIAKGSVVNIIREFRDGTLELPSDLVDYTDELRRVAVDLKSCSMSVTGMRGCLELQARLASMGVSEHEVERWLDVCQRIAYPDTSTEQFVRAALELARQSTGHGMGYARVVEEYEAKTRQLSELEEELDGKRLVLLSVRLDCCLRPRPCAEPRHTLRIGLLRLSCAESRFLTALFDGSPPCVTQLAETPRETHRVPRLASV